MLIRGFWGFGFGWLVFYTFLLPSENTSICGKKIIPLYKAYSLQRTSEGTLIFLNFLSIPEKN